MAKQCLKFIITAAFLMIFNTSLQAQGAADVLRYSLQYPSYDPVSLVTPGVSDATGFGSFQGNPAVTALFDESFFSFSLSDQYVSEDGTFRGNVTDFDNNQVSVGNIGFVYKVPTQQGKLTIGGGYSQSHDFNRALAVTGRNNQSTITDSFISTPDDSLFFAAFDAFAIDNVDPDDSSSEVASIFRVDSPFQGIDQTSELTERGVLGEFSAFIATEFLKDLVVGASIGVISGDYEFRRDFLESDTQNDYETQFEDENGNLTGVDNILVEDRIDASFAGFSLRFGAVYQLTPNFTIGGSYQFRNVLNVEEEFNTAITNTLDDGFQFFDDAPGAFEYQIVRPARANVGITAKDLAGVTISASAERVAYSQGRIEFNEIDLQDAENFENNIVESNLEDVVNLRFGLEYKITDQFIPRIGYAYFPSPTRNVDAERQFFSGGFTAEVSEDVNFNIGAQLGVWQDENTLYTSDFGDEFAQEDVMHLNVMGGFTFKF